MPLHNHQCGCCGSCFEAVVKWDEYTTPCPECSCDANRIYTQFNGIKTESPTWMYDTLEVVDKDGGRHCQEFLKNPNRDNYKNWMKGEGLRPVEDGEKLSTKKNDTSGLRNEIKKKFSKDNSITVGGM